MSTDQTMLMERRIECLERQLVWCRRLGGMGLVGIVVTVAAGMAHNACFETIKAKSFVLVDDDGHKLGELVAKDGVPALRLHSADGRRGAYLSISNDAQETVSVGVFGNGNRALLKSQKVTTGTSGRGYSRLEVGNNKRYAELKAGDDLSPTMSLNRDGSVRVRATAHPNRSEVTVRIGEQEETLVVPADEG